MQAGWKRNLTIVGIIAGVYVGLKYILPVMIPFFVGWLMAVWMYPLVCRLERKTRIKKSLYAGIFMGGIAVLAAGLVYKGGEILFSQLKAWIGNYEVLEGYLYNMVDDCCRAVENLLGIHAADTRNFIMESMEKMQNNFLEDMGPDTFFQATSYIKGLIVAVSWIIIAVISGVLFVKDLADIRKNLRTFRFYPRWRRVLRRLKETGATYLKAQIIIMFVIALICTIGMWLLKSPYYLLFGVGLGVLDALPIIGTGLFLYPTIIFLLLKGKTWMAVGCILIELVTSVVREFMEPRLIGSKLGVYPVVFMAAAYVGFLLFGVLGFILGPAGLLLIYAIGKEWDVWD